MTTHRCRCAEAKANDPVRPVQFDSLRTSEDQDLSADEARHGCDSHLELVAGVAGLGIYTRIDANLDFIKQVAVRSGIDLGLPA